MKTLDQLLEFVSEWVARNTSPFGLVAVTAGVTAGVRPYRHLPIDRRDIAEKRALDKPLDFSERREVVYLRRIGDLPERRPATISGFWDDLKKLIDSLKRRPGSLPTVSSPIVKCSDPQYCWIHGHACACCGGSDNACPSGTVRGHYWSYCCSNRTIWFVDCCGGTVTCPTTKCPWCENSSQPNWCLGFGGGRYVCTLAEDKGAC